MSQLFDIQAILITVMDYPMSYVECIGTLFGLLTVYWAARANIWTWPAGIVNEIFFFAIFFQVQLYANMLLQVIFFITTLYGWYIWKTARNSKNGPLCVTFLTIRKTLIIAALIALCSAFFGYLVAHLHVLLPHAFPQEAAHPYADATVMSISIAATILLARKKVQSWLLWIINNIICIALYLMQGIYFIAIEYIIFLLIASFGLYQWQKLAKQANAHPATYTPHLHT
ncbi:MAG: nicotinamide riboside transporter PnuC [Saezia sp.]